VHSGRKLDVVGTTFKGSKVKNSPYSSWLSRKTKNKLRKNGNNIYATPIFD